MSLSSLTEEAFKQSLTELNNKTGEILHLMDSTHNLWKDIHKDCENNNFQMSGGLNELNISIYEDYKEKSDVAEQILENIAKILEELKIAKAKKEVNKRISTEINQEIINLSKSANFYEKYRNNIRYTLKNLKYDTSLDPELLKMKSLRTSSSVYFGINMLVVTVSSFLLYSNHSNMIFSTRMLETIRQNNVIHIFYLQVGYQMMVNMFLIKPSVILRQIKYSRLSRNLSKLFQKRDKLDIELKNFVILVDNKLNMIKDCYSKNPNPEQKENFDDKIENLITITQKLSDSIEDIRLQLSQNEDCTKKM